jgi:hypothetical protein
MKYNNQDVTAVKYTGRDTSNVYHSNSPVSKIINQHGIIMWESEWYVTTILRTTSGIMKSSTYPNCYYATGTITLEPYLAEVQLVNPQYATHSWSYIASTGRLNYTVYSEEANSEIVVLIFCYRYLKFFEAYPEISVTVLNGNLSSFSSTISYTIKNNNDAPMVCEIVIKNNNGSIVHTKTLIVQKRDSNSVTITVSGAELIIVASFYAIGYNKASTTKYFYPFN